MASSSCPSLFYSAPKHVVVRNFYIRLCWVIFLLTVAALILLVLYFCFHFSYEYSTQIESAVSLQVFGVIKSRFSSDRFKKGVNITVEEMALYNRVWSPSVFIVPHIQSNEVFIATNLIVQPNQTLSKCPEDPAVSNALCEVHSNEILVNNKTLVNNETLINDETLANTKSSTNNCRIGKLGSLKGIDANGVPTGRCIPTEFENGTDTFTCEIEGWCPVLRENSFPLVHNEPVMTDISEVEVVISSSVNFAAFHYAPVRSSEFKNFRTCNISDDRCPRFRLGTIIERANKSTPFNKSLEDVYKYGATFVVHVHWKDCKVGKECTPDYVPKDINSPEEEAYVHQDTFRFIETQRLDLNIRSLVRAHGIRVIVLVSGSAQQNNGFFSGTFFKNILPYVTYMTIACQIFALILMKCYKNPDEESPYKEQMEDTDCKHICGYCFCCCK